MQAVQHAAAQNNGGQNVKKCHHLSHKLLNLCLSYIILHYDNTIAPNLTISPSIAPNSVLTLNLLTTTIVAAPSNASKWQMGFNSAFKGLKEDYECVE